LIASLLISGLGTACAQGNAPVSRRGDSLETVLKTQADSARAFTSLRLSDYYLRLGNGSDSVALYHSREALGFFSKTDNGFGLAWAEFEEGTALMAMRKLDKALLALDSAKEVRISDTVKRKNELLGTIWNQIATVYDDQGNLALSTDIVLNKVLPYYEDAKDERRIAFTSASLATSFLNLRQYDKAVDYYKKELLDYKGPKTESYFAVDYSRLAFCLTQLGRLKEARPFLDSAWKVLQSYPKSYPWLKYYDANANWYEKQGLHDRALANYNAALAVAAQIHDRYNSVNALFGKYDVLYCMRKFSEAKSVAYAIYNLNLSMNDTVAFDRIGIYKTLYEAEKAVGNGTGALKWMERYSGLSDSIHTVAEKIKLNNLEIKYEAEKKEKEILKLQNTAKQQQLTLNRNRLILVFLIAALLLTGLLLGVYFLNARNKNKLLVFNAMLEGQENERRRLSSDLHDGLGGMISGIKLNLQSIAETSPEHDRLQPIIRQMSDAVRELRRIAHNLMPENLLRFGLHSALTDLCERSQHSGTAVSFYAAGLNSSLPQQEQLTIYRIVQELLNNAVKYASATEILVQCIQVKDQLSITVEDDGAGFDIDQLRQKTGMGLFNVQNRTRYLKGTIEMHSGKGIGTTINVNLKVSEHEEVH
jgi:signal transduction histidine kinase